MWKQSGLISLSHYSERERNFPGWHLNGDSVGYSSLLSLLEEFSRGSVSLRTLRITAPTESQLAVPNNEKNSVQVPSKLILSCSEEPETWWFPAALKPASLSFGLKWLKPLRKGITGIPEGCGDYSIGSNANGSLPLWFWW